MTPATDIRWQRDAACLDYPQEWWFPSHNTDSLQVRRAKELCRGCLVRRECLIFAMSRREDHGIWGGLRVASLDHYRHACCEDCGRRATLEEAAEQAIKGKARGWTCRACWYRRIQERKRA